MGNIRSLQKAFEYLGQEVEVIQTPDKIREADAILIPGDGAFGMAMSNIRKQGFYEPVREFIESGKAALGVCIGFQILFESSPEFQTKEPGFGYFSGPVEKFPEHGLHNEKLTIPHMGWNKLDQPSGSRSLLLKGVPEGSYFYFVHSYRVDGVHADATGTADYGGPFTAVVERENLFGVQFHPEKSDIPGLQVLKNFMEHVQCS